MNQENIEKLKAAKEAQARQQAEAAEAFRKELETPIPKDEADKAFADIEVRLAQLGVQRVRAVGNLTQAQQVVNQIDEQIGIAQLERQIVYRRSLNVKDDEAAPAAPEGPTDGK